MTETVAVCPPDDRLAALVAGTAAAAEVDALAAHLESCPGCQGRLAALDGVRTGTVVAALRKPAAALPAGPWADLLTVLARRAPADPARGTEEEVRPLLRRRLLALALATAFAGGAVLAMQVARVGDEVTVTAAGPVGVALAAALAAGAAGVAAYLWRRPGAPVGRLRAAELGLAGLVVTYMTYFRFVSLSGLDAMTFSGPDHRGLYVEQSTLLTNLGCYLIIVGYGLFVPNTGRRCLAVVAAIAAVSLAGLAVAVGRVAPDRVAGAVAATTMGLTLTCSMAVFGSYRISTLQREAAAARRLGQYKLVRKLGEGGMGEVWLAEHALLKRPCAVKLIRPDRAGDARLLERFEREVRATAGLTHPNTVEVYDYGRADDGTFYYVMEYLPGPTLGELVDREGPLPPARAVHLLRQVCGALAEAHAAGLVHRDVKPGNVLVVARGGEPDVAKLLDFGLVRADAGAADGGAGLTREGMVMGTPDYMAPEQALGKPAGPAADLYGLGAVAYFLLAGRPPFRAESVIELLHAHARTPAPPLADAAPGVPADLAAVVMRCLAKSPGDRFAGAAELDAALAGCRAG